MPRFVVLHHQCPPGYPRASHWDFMLEADGILRTWALAAPPDVASSSDLPIDAEPLADHRLAYLELAGPLSGGRGNVSRYDRGEYRAKEWTPEMVVVRLSGARLSGRATLLKDASDAQRWRFWFLPDASGSAGGGAGESGDSSA